MIINNIVDNDGNDDIIHADDDIIHADDDDD